MLVTRVSRHTDWGDLMAIYIKGVELLTKDNSYTVITVYNDGDVFVRVTEKGETIRKYFTDAVGIPEPHGRLIDADGLSKKLCKTTIFIKDGEVFQRMISDAPTVIEGSE